ncbi:hypothetical protein COLO4_31298 [Corchorus olitorius]|uniref:Uncharacterized protein n=1 Tax=Corchorus olitorius TaxID=93759 RepID=A0A1R3H4V3_9ROSI|nr:hypothetical protein COLO4_31298 [Corchorus olitorius]
MSESSLKQWFPIEVELAKHSRIRVINVNASVFASGSDKLCLVWHYFDFTRARYSNYRKVECLEIKLNKSYSASGILNLTAHQESYHFFHVSSGCPEQIFVPMPKWRTVDQSFEKCVNQGAILDHILYTVWEDATNLLYGFDLICKQWFPVNVKLPKVNRIAASVLPSSSDKLCLVWHCLENKKVERRKYRKVECLELKPNKSYSASGVLNLTASVEYYHFFHVSTPHFRQIFVPM